MIIPGSTNTLILKWHERQDKFDDFAVECVSKTPVSLGIGDSSGVIIR